MNHSPKAQLRKARTAFWANCHTASCLTALLPPSPVSHGVAAWCVSLRAGDTETHTWALEGVRAVQVVLDGVGGVAGRAGVNTGQDLSRLGPQGAVVSQGVGAPSPHVTAGRRIQPIVREAWRQRRGGTFYYDLDFIFVLNCSSALLPYEYLYTPGHRVLYRL